MLTPLHKQNFKGQIYSHSVPFCQHGSPSPDCGRLVFCVDMAPKFSVYSFLYIAPVGHSAGSAASPKVRFIQTLTRMPKNELQSKKWGHNETCPAFLSMSIRIGEEIEPLGELRPTCFPRALFLPNIRPADWILKWRLPRSSAGHRSATSAA